MDISTFMDRCRLDLISTYKISVDYNNCPVIELACQVVMFHVCRVWLIGPYKWNNWTLCVRKSTT